MGDLGELAAQRAETEPAERITFTWHGVRVRCRAKLPAMAGLELASLGERAEATPDSASTMIVGAAFYRFLQGCIDPADWEAFKAACIEHGDDETDLLPLVQTLVEASTGRPTEQRSGSGALPLRTSGGSTQRSASVA
jgi:hypothetical protein